MIKQTFISALFFFISFNVTASYYGKLAWKESNSSAWRYYNLYKGETATLGYADDKATWVERHNGTTHISLFKAQNYGGHLSLVVERDRYLPDGWKKTVRSTKKGSHKLDFCFYEETNFKGTAHCYAYHAADLSYDIKGKIKSIYVSTPITVFTGENYDGEQLTISSSIAYLSTKWKKGIKSAHVNNAICLYKNTDYKGWHYCYKKDVEILPDDIYKKARSLTVLKPVTVYAEGKYKGDTNLFSGIVRDLSIYSWQYKIASFRFGEHFPDNPIACFYKQTNYGAPRYCIDKDTPSLGWFDKMAQSARVWESINVYDAKYYGGTEDRMQGDMADLNVSSWGNRISSVKKIDEWPKDAFACFYNQENYQGDKKCFDQDTPYLPLNMNDKVKSIKLKETITVFQHGVYKGDSWSLKSNTPKITYPWNTYISSIKRGNDRPPQGDVCLFTQTHYNGDRYCYNHDVSHLADGIFQKAESLQTKIAITAYDKANYQGHSLFVNTDMPDLWGTKDRIASLKIGEIFPKDYLACFYQGHNFVSQRVCITEDTKDLGWFKKRARSVRVTTPIYVYDKINYQGSKITISEDTANLGDYGWDYKIDSAKKYDDFPPSAFACFYSEENYVGTRFCFNADTPYIPGIFPSIKSIKVKTPITVFSKIDYKGDSRVIRANTPKITSPWTSIKSVKKGDEQPATAKVCLFTEYQFKGDRYCYNREVKRLTDGIYKRVKSIKTLQKITVYEQANFQGWSTMFDSDQSQLSGYWSNRIASFKFGDHLPSSSLACFYSGFNYSGYRYCINKDNPDFTWFNDMAKSVKVITPIKAFEHIYFQGDYIELTANIPYLENWSDRISSAKKFNYIWPTNAIACFFSQHNYQGERYCINGNKPWFKEFNDKARSVQVKQTVTGFEHGFYKGDSLVIDKDRASLGIHWDNKISSAKKGTHGWPEDAKACFYSKPNFQGGRYCINKDTAHMGSFAHKAESLIANESITVFKKSKYLGESKHYFGQHADLGDWKKQIASVKIGDHHIFEICIYEHANYDGKKYCFYEDIENLGNDGYDGSLNIRNPDMYGGDDNNGDDDGDSDENGQDEFIGVTFYRGQGFDGEEHHHTDNNSDMSGKNSFNGGTKTYPNSFNTRNGDGFGSARVITKRSVGDECN